MKLENRFAAAEGNQQIKEFMLPDVEATFRIFAAHWRTVSAGWSFPLHSHSLFEINLLLEGCQRIKLRGREYVQKPGDIVLLKPDDLHESLNEGNGNMTYYCIHFDTDERALREMLCRGESQCFPEHSELAGKIRPCLDKLLHLASQEYAGKLETKMSILSAMFELFAALTANLSQRESRRATDSRTTRIAGLIAAGLERVVGAAYAGEFVSTASGVRTGSAAGAETDNPETESADMQNSAQADTVAAVIRGLGYSPSACSRMFHNVYGMSPRQYLSQLKLKKAKLLLMQPELSVEMVAKMTGYGDIAHFSRQFKRWTGEAPGRFREKHHI